MQRLIQLLVVSAILIPSWADAQHTLPADTADTVSADSVQEAISVAELAGRTRAIADHLRRIQGILKPDARLTEIESAWPRFKSGQDRLAAETDTVVAAEVSEVRLDELRRRLQIQVVQLASWEETLSQQIDALSSELTATERAGESWRLTQSAAEREELPPILRIQIDSVVQDIADATNALRARLSEVLELEGRVTLESVEAGTAQDRLGQFETEALLERLRRVGVPLWRVFAGGEGVARRPERTRITEAAEVSARYLSENLPLVGLHLALLLALIVGFGALGRRLVELSEEDESLNVPTVLFKWPWLPATLISLIATGAVYPLAPDVLVTFATILSIPVTVYLLHRQLPESLHRMLAGLGALVFLFILVRAVGPSHHPVLSTSESPCSS